MKINALTPMLYTEKMRETVEFYTEVLGFTCPNFVEEWGWAALRHGDVEIMFSLPNAHISFEKPVFTGAFYFKVEDADEVWEKLKDKAGVSYPIEDFKYGMREFAVYDNNGYLLQFGQEISSDND
ncbi:MAG TPA: VOC family protein [Pyrinomonadaceae bacterium]|jgi:uncharacterized glyoxalase superfamily protein PhnB|nr:VOC family protein [Pyrinomonadaceae bacterium]